MAFVDHSPMPATPDRERHIQGVALLVLCIGLAVALSTVEVGAADCTGKIAALDMENLLPVIT